MQKNADRWKQSIFCYLEHNYSNTIKKFKIGHNYSNTIPPRFNDHFQKPDVIDIPGPEFKKQTDGIDFEIDDWIQCIDFPIVFSIKGNTSHFYCDHVHCKHWYSMSNTFGNVKSHIKSKHLIQKENLPELIEDHASILNDSNEIIIPTDIDKLISSKFKSMILKTGRPFSLVDNNDMKGILKHLDILYYCSFL